MATRYDITANEIAEAFGRIEEDLLESMFRNLERHTVEEAESGFEWAQWQAAQLAELEKYARNNGYNYGPRFAELNARIEENIREAFDNGRASAEMQLLQAVLDGYDAEPQQGFLRMPRERMDALIKATTSDMQKAEYATLRKASDAYRQTIFTAQTYAVSGAGTYGRAIDMATRDFVSRGINGIMYRNGSMHGIEEYSRMAVRTAAKRAALVAEGEARREWGVHTVFVNYRVDACPECMEWVGRVLIDDVYSGGTAEEAAESGYPLLSEAMAQGLFHPNCRDTMSTYFEGISELPDRPTDAEVFNREQAEIVEQWRDRMESEAERNERLSRFSLDFEDKRRYAEKAEKIGETGEASAVSRGTAAMLRDYSVGDVSLAELTGDAAEEIAALERDYTDALYRWEQTQFTAKGLKVGDTFEFSQSYRGFSATEDGMRNVGGVLQDNIGQLDDYTLFEVVGDKRAFSMEPYVAGDWSDEAEVLMRGRFEVVGRRTVDFNGEKVKVLQVRQLADGDVGGAVEKVTRPAPTGARTPGADMVFRRYETDAGVSVLVQDGLDVSRQDLDIDRLVQIINDLPPEVQEKVQREIYVVDYENPRDSHWRKVYKNFTRSYMVGGEDITIWASTNHDYDYVREAIIHETGHGIDRSLRTPKGTWYSDRTAWRRAMDADLAFSGRAHPTRYAANARTEDFAESLAMFYTEPDVFAAVFPNRAAIIRKIMGLE